MNGEENSSFSLLPDEVIVHILEHLDIVSKRKARLTCLRWRVIMNTGDNWTLFGLLSDKVVLHILNLLSLPGKKNIRMVCSRWRWLMDDPRLGGLIFQPIIDNNSSAGFLMNTCRDIENVCFTNVTETLEVYNSHKFPHIRNAKLRGFNAAVNVITFLRLGCEYVENLKLGGLSLENVSVNTISYVIQGIQWNNLRQLELCATIWDWDMNDDGINYGISHLASVERFLKLAITPRIETLILHVRPICYKPIFSLFSEFYGYIERHTSSLKGLELKLFTRIHPEPLIVSEHMRDSIRQNLRLDCLKIEVQEFSIMNRVVLPCLLESERLSTIKWHSWVINDDKDRDEGTTSCPAAKEQILSLIKRNETTIVDFGFMSFEHSKDLLDLHWLQNCPELKKLSFRQFNGFMNPEVSFPNITYLEIRDDYPWPFNFDSWIIRNFINLETLKIYGDNWWSINIVLELSWVQNLLSQLRLKELCYWCFPCGADRHDHDMEYDQNIRVFCQNTPTLLYKIRPYKLHNGYTDERVIKISKAFQREIYAHTVVHE